jgi:tetratricopeptide (TPR) repeat protein
LLSRAIENLDDGAATTYLAESYQWLGHIDRYRGRLDGALANHRQARALYHAAGNVHGESYALGSQGRDLFLKGEARAAFSMFREAMGMARQLDDRRGIASGNTTLALFNSFHPDPTRDTLEETVSLYRAGLPYLAELGDWGALAEVLEGAVPLLVELGHPRDAARVWGAIISAQDEFDVHEILRANLPRGEEILEKAVGPARDRLVEAGRAMSIADATQLVLERFALV